MNHLEELELDAHREEMSADVRALVEKYGAIFEWDVPEVDIALLDRVIVKAIRHALDDIEKALPHP